MEGSRLFPQSRPSEEGLPFPSPLSPHIGIASELVRETVDLGWSRELRALHCPVGNPRSERVQAAGAEPLPAGFHLEPWLQSRVYLPSRTPQSRRSRGRSASPVAPTFLPLCLRLLEYGVTRTPGPELMLGTKRR